MIAIATAVSAALTPIANKAKKKPSSSSGNQIVIRLTSGMELNYPHDTVSYYCASDNAICDQRVARGAGIFQVICRNSAAFPQPLLAVIEVLRIVIGGLRLFHRCGGLSDFFIAILKEVFGLDDINDLPIVYNIAWYEQKAVIVLLALLALGVKNIHLGPTLPAFLSPDVAKILTDTFGIAGIGTVEDDLKLFFGK